MSGTYVCDNCGETVSKRMVHKCPMGFQPVPEEREGTYFVDPDTGTKWDIEEICRWREAHKTTTSTLQQKIEVLSTNMSVSEKEVAQLRTDLQMSKETAQANYKLYEDKQTQVGNYLQDIRELSGKNIILTDAVAELKSILFQKELAIAQNSGYISRVREIDPKNPEPMVEIPSRMISLHDASASAMMATDHYSGSNTWGLRWWDLGNEKKKER